MPSEADRFDAQFWAKIYSMDTASTECLSEVQALLICPFKIEAARSLRGNEAQKFIDFLDRVLACSYLDDKLQQRGLRLLSKICRAHKIMPSSYILQQEPIQIGQVCHRGGFADVSKGEYLGCSVAIKHLKTNEGNSYRVFKRLCREIINWKHLSHPNILPLLGVSMSTDCFRILTEWMPNGNLMQYTKFNTDANRLQLLSEVASGAVYLHELKIVHGDLKGANVLVDNTGTARIADFGLMTMADLSAVLLSETAVSPGGTLCWMSPELLDPPRFGSNGRPTRESDCYALGMVIYEVLTGRRPFHHISACTPVPAVLRGERPKEPLDAESLGFSDALWGLVQLCWNESSSTRPNAQLLLDHLSTAALTWAPPPVYPSVWIDTESITDSDSSSSLGITPANFTSEV